MLSGCVIMRYSAPIAENGRGKPVTLVAKRALASAGPDEGPEPTKSRQRGAEWLRESTTESLAYVRRTCNAPFPKTILDPGRS